MQVQMGPLEVINITAIAGDKGHSHAYQCQDNTNGTNILSSVFQPQDKIMVSGRGTFFSLSRRRPFKWCHQKLIFER